MFQRRNRNRAGRGSRALSENRRLSRRKGRSQPGGRFFHTSRVCAGAAGEWASGGTHGRLRAHTEVSWRNTMKRAKICLLVLALVTAFTLVFAQSGTGELLKLESTVPMADVQGRIDHLSIDVKGERLFVAALGNNSLEVIDVKEKKRVHTISGLAEPQGIAYLPSSNRLFVANGKDGSVRAFDAASWKMLKSISYGDDADNLRFDSGSGHIWVGYGGGALGEFDAEGNRISDIKL